MRLQMSKIIKTLQNKKVSILIVNQMGKTCIFEVDSKF